VAIVSGIVIVVIGLCLLVWGIFDVFNGEAAVRRDVLANARIVSRAPFVGKKLRARVLDPEWQERQIRFGVSLNAVPVLAGVVVIYAGIARLVGI
jgi:hypothetical protein